MDPYGYYRVALNALIEHFFSTLAPPQTGHFVKVGTSYMAGAEMATIDL